MQRRAGLLGLLGWPALAGTAARAQGGSLRARLPLPPRDTDPDTFYPLQVLRAALAASGAPHHIDFSHGPLIQARALRELELETGEIDLVWSMSSRAREQALRAVRVPIYRGLYGWRLLLVRRGEAARFAKVRSLADLRGFRLVQGADWPDTQILAANGLQVVTADSFEGLFHKLASGAADALPRSALEIWPEFQVQAARFEVEPQLVLHYRAPMYFFVARSNTGLAQALERGMRRLVARGDLQALLERLHGKDLRRARLAERRVIELHNPLLPADAVDPREFYRPGE